MSTSLNELLACPRCDKTPLIENDGVYRCEACKIDFPSIDGIPWMFAEPQATLGEWRGRLQFSLQQLSQESARLEAELGNKDLRPLTKRRIERYKKATDSHRRSLAKILQPVDVQSLHGDYEGYLALRTRLPADQGLNTYYANVHRDWAWGGEENKASIKQVRAVLHENAELGNVLVLGAGAGRLAYDLHQCTSADLTVALDFNPLLAGIAARVSRGETIELWEFPIAPRTAKDHAVLRKFDAEAARPGLEFVLGDALRAPFRKAAFDTVITPWLVDILPLDFGELAARVNGLLAKGGSWVNFGSLAFDAQEESRHYTLEECVALLERKGFGDPQHRADRIPYMCSPASRHGRMEEVVSFRVTKAKNIKPASRYQSLPEWLVTGKEAVPALPAFQLQAASNRIFAFVMGLIDGKRSIDDMAQLLESQRLMQQQEADGVIRDFLTRMYEDSRRSN